MPDSGSSSGYAVGWGASALINAALAQSKRRSGLPWFVLSLLLGPVATLLIVILPVAEQTEGAGALSVRHWILMAVVLLVVAIALVSLLAGGSGGVGPGR